jgi:F0F1-type ATP synthase membrane subunit b/b'
MQEAIDKGQQVAAEIRSAAEDSREKLLARTHDDIEREKAKAIAEIRDAAVDLSFAISSKVMKDGLDRNQHDRLVSSFIGELKELK